GADGPYVFHFPGAGLIAICSDGQCADGTDVDAGAALIAFKMVIMIGDDLGNRTAVSYAQCSHAHAFVTGAYAAVAQDAAWGVEVHDRAPLLFVDVQFALKEAALAGSVAEDHVL